MELSRFKETRWVKYEPNRMTKEAQDDEPEMYEIRFAKEDALRLDVVRADSERASAASKKDPEATADELSQYDEKGPLGWMVRSLVRNVVNWKGINLDGKPWPCTDENKRTLFSEFILTRGQYLFRQTRDEMLFLGRKLEDEVKN